MVARGYSKSLGVGTCIRLSIRLKFGETMASDLRGIRDRPEDSGRFDHRDFKLRRGRPMHGQDPVRLPSIMYLTIAPERALAGIGGDPDVNQAEQSA